MKGFENFRVTGLIEPADLGRASVSVRDVDRFSAAVAQARGEYVREGDRITGLYVANKLVMSDVRDEYRDHAYAISQAYGRVLIHGLGLGCYLKAILAKPEVLHVDVVELEEDVIALIGPYFADDPRVHIHQGDAYTYEFPKGTTWDVAWHDIWADKCTDDLALHAKLNRRYGRKVSWQGCWAHEYLLYRRRQEREPVWSLS